MTSLWKSILKTGLLVGVTDILYAYTNQFIRTGKFASKMFQFIAGGALGLEKSMKGGIGTIILGAFFHFSIALIATIVFYFICPRLPLNKSSVFTIILVGFFYGIIVDLVMKFIVLPMSALPASPPIIFTNLLINWFFFGLVFGIPIVWLSVRYYKTL